MSYQEIEVYIAIHKTFNFYMSRKRSKDWPQWNNDNPGQSKYLEGVMMLAMNIRESENG